MSAPEGAALRAGGMPDALADALGALGYSQSKGLITSQTPFEVNARQYYWQEQRSKVGLDALFFRDGVPLIGFSSDSDQDGLANLRRKLWNYGRVPLLANVTQQGMFVFDVESGFEDDNAAALITQGSTQDIAQGLMQGFSRSQIESGYLEVAFKRDLSTRVDSALLRNLRAFRRQVVTSRGLTTTFESVDTLIVASITATYLTDRQIIDPERLAALTGSESLHVALASGRRATLDFFRGLADRFNGDVFSAVPGALAGIDDGTLAGMSALIRGDDLETGQQSLWPYDFSVLPADLVSSIYEQLLRDTQRKDGSYYTPRFLVDAVLDEVLPWEDETLPRIADLACGSGAFLTEAFKRLVFRRRAHTEMQLSNDHLQDILTACIYGIDINASAARIAAFGLYLALLEEAHDPAMWVEATLPSLIGENLVVADAFDESALIGQSFDIIATNPPWISQLSDAARKWLKTRKRTHDVADRQIASAFVWLAMDRLRPGGQLGVVLPSKAFLHNRSTSAQSFRSSVFREFDVGAVVDLSAVRHSVFSNAVAPTAVLIATKPEIVDSFDPGRPNKITHVAVHPRRTGRVPNALLVVPEEVRRVTRSQVLSRPDIWKVLLWGSERDLKLINRLGSSNKSLGALAQERGWRSGRGFQIAGGGREDTSTLLGLNRVATRDIQRLRVREVDTIFEDSYAHRPRERRLYSAPLILIRRGVADRRINAVLVREDTTFPDGVIGISGQPEDAGLLALITLAISSSLGTFWHFMTSSSWAVERDYVEHNEHLLLPVPESSQQQRDTAEQILALAATSDDPNDLDERVDEFVFDVYNLTKSERRRVRAGAREKVNRFYRRGTSTVSTEAFGEYAETLRSVLSTTLEGLAVQAATFESEQYRTVAVSIGEPPDNDAISTIRKVDVDAVAESLNSEARRSTGLLALPGGMYFDENRVYIVKNSDEDRWTSDAALDDADRIVASLLDG